MSPFACRARQKRRLKLKPSLAVRISTNGTVMGIYINTLFESSAEKKPSFDSYSLRPYWRKHLKDSNNAITFYWSSRLHIIHCVSQTSQFSTTFSFRVTFPFLAKTLSTFVSFSESHFLIMGYNYVYLLNHLSKSRNTSVLIYFSVKGFFMDRSLSFCQRVPGDLFQNKGLILYNQNKMELHKSY